MSGVSFLENPLIPNWGYISYVTPHPAVKTFAPVAGMWLGSIYDNIDWDAYADRIRDNIMEKYERGDDISDM